MRQHPPPPPPTIEHPPSAAQPSVTTRFPHPVALFLVAVGIGLLAATPTGFLVGGAIESSLNADCSPHDGWCDFSGLFYGFVVGMLAAYATYLAAGAVVIGRCRPTGSRAGHVTAHALAPVATLVALITLANFIPV